MAAIPAVVVVGRHYAAGMDFSDGDGAETEEEMARVKTLRADPAVKSFAMRNDNPGGNMLNFIKNIAPFRKPIEMRPALYLTLITLGMASFLTGILWLWQFGAAAIIFVQLITGRFSGGKVFMTSVGCLFVLGALASGIWQIKMALRDGQLWLRIPPPWWWVGFILLAWISMMVTELRRKTPR